MQMNDNRVIDKDQKKKGMIDGLGVGVLRLLSSCFCSYLYRFLLCQDT